MERKLQSRLIDIYLELTIECVDNQKNYNDGYQISTFVNCLNHSAVKNR